MLCKVAGTTTGQTSVTKDTRKKRSPAGTSYVGTTSVSPTNGCLSWVVFVMGAVFCQPDPPLLLPAYPNAHLIQKWSQVRHISFLNLKRRGRCRDGSLLGFPQANQAHGECCSSIASCSGVVCCYHT